MTTKCNDCGKEIKRFVFTCPACKTKRCSKCAQKHMDAKGCEYAKATSIDVKLW